MTEVNLALMAIPGCVPAPLGPSLVPAIPAATSDSGVGFTVFHWEVKEWKVCGWSRMSIVTLFGVIVPHKTFCQLQSELLERLPCCTRVVTVEDVCISNSNFKQKPKDVAVELPTLHPHMVVLPQLVILVHPSHVAVVQGHCCWAWNIGPRTIMLTSLDNVDLERLSVGGENSDNSVVSPQEG